jgi:flagellar hook-basal body complex protein FliE
MTSAISAISGLAGTGGLDALTGVGDADTLTGTTATTDTATTGTAAVQAPNESFAGLLAKGLDSVQTSQTNADNLAVKVADGSLSDPAQYTMAANEASLGLQLTLAVRNKALDAFQEIMRMQA